MTNIATNIVASAEMLINKQSNEVFDAFVEPRTIEKFWLKGASAPLAKNARVEWEFIVPGARETVTVTYFVEHRLIVFVWSNGMTVNLTFDPHGKNGTRLAVQATGFAGVDASSHAIGATEGSTIVLCDLKCLLETGQSGNMVRDKAALITANKTDA